MSTPPDLGEQDRQGAILFGFLAIAHALGRWWSGHVPADFAGYVAAAQARWVHGASAYDLSALEALPVYQGYPFIYLPGTLPMLWPLGVLPVEVVLAADAVGRVVALACVGRWLTRRFDLPLEWPQVALALGMFAPLGETFLHGNLALYMFAAFCAADALTAREVGGARGFAAGLALGCLLMFKPMWGIPCAWLAAWRGRWAVTAGLAAGACAVGGASVAQPGQMEAWRGLVEAARGQWRAVDLGVVGVGGYVAGGAAWLAGGAWLWARRRGHELAWAWACVSLLAWPRVSTYSHALMAPLVCALWARAGWKVALAVSLPMLGPVPFLLGSVDGGFARLVASYAWSACLAAWVCFAIVRGGAGREEAHPVSSWGDPDDEPADDTQPEREASS